MIDGGSTAWRYSRRMVADLHPLPVWLGLDERRAQRWPLDWPTSISTTIQASSAEARVIDLSTYGCRLIVRGSIAVGRYLKLLLPFGIETEGWVAWTNGPQAGVDFAHALPSGLVEQIVQGPTRHAADLRLPTSQFAVAMSDFSNTPDRKSDDLRDVRSAGSIA